MKSGLGVVAETRYGNPRLDLSKIHAFRIRLQRRVWPGLASDDKNGTKKQGRGTNRLTVNIFFPE
jgi:hypothetical protein